MADGAVWKRTLLPHGGLSSLKEKIAIIGASDFQNPLIVKAKEMGLETHVFAWSDGSIGERTADFFYPISITEIDKIASVCEEVGVSGICSIGTDLGNITVASVANKLGLVANTVECVRRSTNKHLMRMTFEQNGDPSPWSYEVRSVADAMTLPLSYPLIVKPVDRSGSRSITKLVSNCGLEDAVQAAIDVSFDGAAVIEEFITGEEYSVEFLSWHGRHTFLALTKKYTTGAPAFIETGHLEPAPVPEELRSAIRDVVSHALDGLGVEYGASHAEVLVTQGGEIEIVEIGSRMGGDCIGSDLVPLSTGIDFMRAVIDVSLGREPDLTPHDCEGNALIRFLFSEDDLSVLDGLRKRHSHLLSRYSVAEDLNRKIVDSSTRHGFFILSAENFNDLRAYVPAGENGNA